MKFVFWNINGHDLSSLTALLCAEYDIDVLVLAEYEAFNEMNFLSECRMHNRYLLPCRFVDKAPRTITFLNSKLKFDVIVEGKKYYSVYKFSHKGKDILFFTMHLGSKMWRDTKELEVKCQLYAREISNLEVEMNIENSIVVGDFNINPFSDGIYGGYNFNASFSKKIVKHDFREIDESKVRYFYNPCWKFFANANEPYGTYYSSNGLNTIYWNSFDQVLIRSGLLEFFNYDSLKIIDCIRDISLLTRTGLPNKKYSDHLPIIFEIN